jgi:hypothetical protein
MNIHEHLDILRLNNPIPIAVYIPNNVLDREQRVLVDRGFQVLQGDFQERDRFEEVRDVQL